MQIIDTHTHLYLKEFKKDVDDVLKRAISNGIDKFIFPAIDSSHMNEMKNLKKKRLFKKIYFTQVPLMTCQYATIL